MDQLKEREYILKLPLDRFLVETNCYDALAHAIRKTSPGFQELALGPDSWQGFVKDSVYKKIHSFPDPLIAVGKFRLRLRDEFLSRIDESPDPEAEDLPSSFEKDEDQEPPTKKTWNRKDISTNKENSKSVSSQSARKHPEQTNSKKTSKSEGPLKTSKNIKATSDTNNNGPRKLLTSSQRTRKGKSGGKQIETIDLDSENSSVEETPIKNTTQESLGGRPSEESVSDQVNNSRSSNVSKGDGLQENPEATKSKSNKMNNEPRKSRDKENSQRARKRKSEEKSKETFSNDSSVNEHSTRNKRKSQEDCSRRPPSEELITDDSSVDDSESTASSDWKAKTDNKRQYLGPKSKRLQVEKQSKTTPRDTSNDEIASTGSSEPIKRKQPRRKALPISDDQMIITRRRSVSGYRSEESEEQQQEIPEHQEISTQLRSLKIRRPSENTSNPLPSFRRTENELKGARKPMKRILYNEIMPHTPKQAVGKLNTPKPQTPQMISSALGTPNAKTPDGSGSDASCYSNVTVVDSQEFLPIGEEQLRYSPEILTPTSSEDLLNKLINRNKNELLDDLDSIISKYESNITDEINLIVSRLSFSPVRETRITQFINDVMTNLSYLDLLTKTNINDLPEPMKTKEEIERFYQTNFKENKKWPRDLKLKQALYFIYGKIQKFTIFNVYPFYMELFEVQSKTNFRAVLEEQLIGEKTSFVENNFTRIVKACFEHCSRENVWLENMELNSAHFDCLERVSVDESIADETHSIASIARKTISFHPNRMSFEEFIEFSDVRQRVRNDGLPENRKILHKLYELVVQRNDPMGFFFHTDMFLKYSAVSGQDTDYDSTLDLMSVNNSEPILSESHINETLQSQVPDYQAFEQISSTSTQTFFETRQLDLERVSRPNVIAEENEPLENSTRNVSGANIDFGSPPCTSTQNFLEYGPNLIGNSLEKDLDKIFGNANQSRPKVTIISDEIIQDPITIKKEILNMSSYDSQVEVIEPEEPVEMEAIVVSDEEDAEQLMKRLGCESSSEESQPTVSLENIVNEVVVEAMAVSNEGRDDGCSDVIQEVAKKTNQEPDQMLATNPSTQGQIQDEMAMDVDDDESNITNFVEDNAKRNEGSSTPEQLPLPEGNENVVEPIPLTSAVENQAPTSSSCENNKVSSSDSSHPPDPNLISSNTSQHEDHEVASSETTEDKNVEANSSASSIEIKAEPLSQPLEYSCYENDVEIIQNTSNTIEIADDEPNINLFNQLMRIQSSDESKYGDETCGTQEKSSHNSSSGSYSKSVPSPIPEEGAVVTFSQPENINIHETQMEHETPMKQTAENNEDNNNQQAEEPNKASHETQLEQTAENNGDHDNQQAEEPNKTSSTEATVIQPMIQIESEVNRIPDNERELPSIPEINEDQAASVPEPLGEPAKAQEKTNNEPIIAGKPKACALKRRVDGTVAYAKHNFRALNLVKKPKLQDLPQKKSAENFRFEIDDTSLVEKESTGDILNHDTTYFRDSQIMQIDRAVERLEDNAKVIEEETDDDHDAEALEEAPIVRVIRPVNMDLSLHLTHLNLHQVSLKITNFYKIGSKRRKKRFMSAIIKLFSDDRTSIEIDVKKLESVLEFSKNDTDRIWNIVDSIFGMKFSYWEWSRCGSESDSDDPEELGDEEYDQEYNEELKRLLNFVFEYMPKFSNIRIESSRTPGCISSIAVSPPLNLVDAFDSDVLEEIRAWKECS